MEVASEQWNEQEHIPSSIQRIPTVTGGTVYQTQLQVPACRQSAEVTCERADFPKLGGNTEYIRPKSYMA